MENQKLNFQKEKIISDNMKGLTRELSLTFNSNIKSHRERRARIEKNLSNLGFSNRVFTQNKLTEKARVFVKQQAKREGFLGHAFKEQVTTTTFDVFLVNKNAYLRKNLGGKVMKFITFFAEKIKMFKRWINKGGKKIILAI